MEYRNYRNYLFDRNNKLIFGWTAKAGCTVVTKMFFKNMNLLDEALNYSPWVHNYQFHKFYKNNGVVNENDLLNKNNIKLKFVRNPYTRAVSSFIHAGKHKHIIKNQNLSFKEFLIKIKNNKIYNSHYGLQICTLEKNNKIFDEIIKIENIKNEINRINKKYNLNLDCDFSSRHHVIKNNNLNSYVGDIKYDDLNNNIPPYKYFYDDEIKQLVYDIYKIDIETYNYEFDLLN